MTATGSQINGASLGTSPIMKIAVDVDYAATEYVHVLGGADLTYFYLGESQIQVQTMPGNTYQSYNGDSHVEEYGYMFGVRVDWGQT